MTNNSLFKSNDHNILCTNMQVFYQINLLSAHNSIRLLGTTLIELREKVINIKMMTLLDNTDEVNKFQMYDMLSYYLL